MSRCHYILGRALVLPLLWLCLAWPSLSFAQTQATEPGAGPKLPDPIYILDGIRLSGAYSTSDHIVLDTLGLEIGQEVNVLLLQEARLKLLASGFFEIAQFGLEPGSTRGHVILKITLEERNAIQLSDLFLGTSQKSIFWGGLDILDGNIFGIGHTARAAFVTSGNQAAFELGWVDPSILGSPLTAALTAHYSDAEDDLYATLPLQHKGLDPIALDLRRAGGRVSLGYTLLAGLGVFLDLGVYHLDAKTPAPELIEGLVNEGGSWLNTLALTLDWDTRDDTVMPTRGVRINLSSTASTQALASNYDYLKCTLAASAILELAPGHLLRLNGLAGTIFGEAPYSERFFIGDFNDLVPARSLGLNFSNQGSPDFFNTGADQLSYEKTIVRASFEYAIPLTQRFDWLYRTEFFLGGGLVAADTPSDERGNAHIGLEPAPGFRDELPVDLTVNLGLRVETSIGIFGLSFANGLTLIPF